MTALPSTADFPVTSATTAATTAATAAAGAADLDHLSSLRVAGPDAIAFLDAQLTRNVPPAARDGEAGVASLAGYCSPKGRLLATFVVWADADGVSLIVSRDIAEAIAKRLRMYLLRTKATIVDESSTHRLVGIAETAASAAAGAPDTSGASHDAWSVTRRGDRTDVRWPTVDGGARVLRVEPVGASGDAAADATPIDAVAWRWMDIRCGLPRVTASTQDRFVPQMLNLEALGGVDFRKGCFPGQEVVARSQYLGKLKRRTALASIAPDAALPAAGSDVWQVGATEACGVVVNAERGADGRIAMLVEMPLALSGAIDLRVGALDGAPVTMEPLPYALPDNEVFVRPKL